MEQMSFNLNELLKREVKQILEGGEPYIYNLIDNDCIEKNAEGIQKQKKLIEEYLIDNKIPNTADIIINNIVLIFFLYTIFTK